MTTESGQRTPLTRRRLLGGALAVGTTTALAGCGDPDVTGAGPSGKKEPRGDFTLPEPVVALPNKDVTFRLVDSNDTKAPFWRQLFQAYQEKHPNIRCQYDGLPWAKIEEVVPLGIRNKTAHDVIQLPGNVPLDQAVTNGWVAPLDDLLPDIEKWKASFPELSYVEGSRVFDGKVYAVRLASDRRYYGALHYNTKLLHDAGYDPRTRRLTWDDYRDAAKKITKAGKGRVFGVVLEGGHPGRLAVYIDHLARSAGAISVGGIDPKTGEYYFARDEIVEAIELMLALKKDGSIFPGSNSLQAPQAWPRVLRGNAAMVTAGPWVTQQWNHEDPDFDFGVAAAPARGPDPYPQAFSELGGDTVCVYAGSKAKAVAADVLSYVTSLEGQTAWAKICGVGNPPVLEEASKRAANTFTEQAKQCVELGNSLVAGPEPLIANPDVSHVLRVEKALSPDFGEVIQSIFVGKVINIKKALTDLKDRAERNRDAAIAAARKNGAKVSREDWVFADWDPRKDFTKADYEAR